MHEGEVDKACALYEKIREMCPGHRYADMAADRLEQLRGLRTGTEEKSKPDAAGDEEDSELAAARTIVTAAYDVSDLVRGANNNIRRTRGEQQAFGKELIEVLINTVEPSSWNHTGGSGTIEYHPEMKALVVNQTRDLHEKI